MIDGGPGFADGSLIPLGSNVPQVLTASELGTIGTVASYIPYLDTGDDFLTLTTGCGYACQAGTEESVGAGWRIVAGIGIFAPLGSSSVRHGLDEIGDVFQYLGSYVDDIFQELTGQWHHVLSNKIFNALGQHEILAGVFGRNDILVQALDGSSHTGYQTWHRLYDNEVVKWLTDNPEATPKDFLEFLQQVYSRSDMQERFPGAAELIRIVIEETTQ